ncbi:unnamed protein product [Zymoseptoria tritici ST99CH_1A5]|uniref:Integrase core domain-containing protein n=1 Tax=Zymoseptoria tritici ST99CH_1A5 TaxID=1276529 RepID=A0A1Y6L7X0_ZYMTR|nr:unnamed protein product [Zymoseptoria tritici ST99CH_1A5]
MDRISMKFIYTPMIRKQLQGFVRTWNKHKIRRQRNRLHVIPGRPHVLYNYSQRPNQGDPIDTEYIKALNETTKGWKIHEYLPKTTIEFCKDILRREGFPSGRAAPANFVQLLDMAQLDFEGDGVDEEAAPEEFYQAYVEDWEDEDD